MFRSTHHVLSPLPFLSPNSRTSAEGLSKRAKLRQLLLWGDLMAFLLPMANQLAKFGVSSTSVALPKDRKTCRTSSEGGGRASSTA